MIYFCADDYGISNECNGRIETCLKRGALNKVSVLANGQVEDFKERLSDKAARLALHLNLVEGYPLSDPKDVPLLVSEQGNFRYSFVGLLCLSLSGKRKELERQLYTEIRNQVVFWKEQMGDAPVAIDSHQHTHMIPLIFRTLMRVLKEIKLNVQNVRFPAEPILPYLLTPSLYGSYSIQGLIKQWLLKLLALFNCWEQKNSHYHSAYFMGVMFSGQMTEDKVKKLLPHYAKLAQKNGKDIEIAFHPGYLEEGERLMDGCQKSFEKFYFSKWRKQEYETLLYMKIENNETKEGSEYALH